LVGAGPHAFAAAAARCDEGSGGSGGGIRDGAVSALAG